MEDAEREGFKIPELDAEPELYEDLLPVWIAFGQLLSGSGDIYFRDIVSYMDEIEISSKEDRQDFVRLIRHLQLVKIEYEQDKLDKKIKKQTPKQKAK